MKKLLPILVIVMLVVAGGTSYFVYSTYTNKSNEKVNDLEIVETEDETESEVDTEELELLKSTELSLIDHYEKQKYIIGIERFKNVFVDSSFKVEPTEEILEVYNNIVYSYFDGVDKFNEDVYFRIQDSRLTPETIDFIGSKFEIDLSVSGSQKEIKQQQEKVRAKKERDKITSDREKEMRASEGVSIGMTKAEVLASNWGKPQKINKTTNVWGTSELWVYPNYNYLHFDDGILTSISTSK